MTNWRTSDTPPTHSNPVLVVVDLAGPQDEILRETLLKPMIKIARWQNGHWIRDGSNFQWGSVVKITHWRELPEMPE